MIRKNYKENTLKTKMYNNHSHRLSLKEMEQTYPHFFVNLLWNNRSNLLAVWTNRFY